MKCEALAGKKKNRPCRMGGPFVALDVDGRTVGGCGLHAEMSERGEPVTWSVPSPSPSPNPTTAAPGHEQPRPAAPSPVGDPAPVIPLDLLAGIPLDGGPAAEPVAAARDYVPEPDPELPELTEAGAEPAGVGGSLVGLRAETWKGHADRAIRGGVNPALERLDMDPLGDDEADWWASAWGDFLELKMAEVDPNNPTGALFLSTVVIFGPRFADRFARKRKRAPNPKGPELVKEPDPSPPEWGGPDLRGIN